MRIARRSFLTPVDSRRRGDYIPKQSGAEPVAVDLRAGDGQVALIDSRINRPRAEGRRMC
jgi:hypothetical protein